MTPDSTHRRSNSWRFYILAVLLLPSIVLWRSRDALFGPPWYADAWFYFGFFRNLVEFKRHFFYGLYYGSRLSWILPGFAVHALLPAGAANCVLHLAVQSACTLSMFSILRAHIGQRAALLATMVFAVNPWLWAATGWDYVDGAGIAYTLMALAFLTRAAFRTSPLYLFLAGCAIAGMAYSHIFLATLAPLVVLYFAGMLAIRSPSDWAGRFWSFALWAGAGVAMVTLSLCIINYFLDGTFWFYGPSTARAQTMARDFQFGRPIWVNHELAPWLWPGVAGGITALALIIAMIRKRAAAKSSPAGLFAAMLLLAGAYMSYLQARGSSVLGHHPYASYLLPFVFLATGMCFWQGTETMASRNFLALCAVSALIFAALWGDPRGPQNPEQPAAHYALLAASACFLCVSFWFRQRAAGAALAVAGFSAFTSFTLADTNNFNGLNLHGTPAEFQRMMIARDRIEAVRHGRPPRFWYDQHEPGFHEYFGLNATYLAELSQISLSFPGDCSKPVPPNSLVIVLTERRDAAALARNRLLQCWQPLGMHPEIESVQILEGKEHPYTLAMLRAEPGSNSIGSPLQVLRSIPLESVRVAAQGATLERNSAGLSVTTLPDMGAFAGQVSLGLDSSAGGRIVVVVRIRCLKGEIGLGILERHRNAFLQERPVWPLPQPIDVVLPLPSAEDAGDLVIRNLATGHVASEAVIEKIEIGKLD